MIIDCEIGVGPRALERLRDLDERVGTERPNSITDKPLELARIIVGTVGAEFALSALGEFDETKFAVTIVSPDGASNMDLIEDILLKTFKVCRFKD